MFEDGYGMPAHVYNHEHQKRMNYFNTARGLFPYNSGTDSFKGVDIKEVIETAKALQAFVEGTENV